MDEVEAALRAAGVTAEEGTFIEELTFVVVGGVRVFADGSYCKDYGFTA